LPTIRPFEPLNRQQRAGTTTPGAPRNHEERGVLAPPVRIVSGQRCRRLRIVGRRLAVLDAEIDRLATLPESLARRASGDA
jgi:hypothetical protein